MMSLYRYTRHDRVRVFLVTSDLIFQNSTQATDQKLLTKWFSLNLYSLNANCMCKQHNLNIKVRKKHQHLDM